MGALSKFSYTNKILAVFFLRVLPELLRLTIIAICIVCKYYKLVTANYNYTSVINKKTSRFYYRKKAKPELTECAICLLELKEGEECTEVVDCSHSFHRHCLEKWLWGLQATCPMCRGLVVPEVIVAEHRRMRDEREDGNWMEKELALILLRAIDGGGCNNTTNGFF